MIILHGSWLDRRLFLWAETAASTLKPEKDLSPYDAGSDALGRVVAALAGSAARARARHARRVSAKLPSQNGKIVPSREFLRRLDSLQGAGPRKTSYRTVSVTALPLSFSETAAILFHASTLARPFGRLTSKISVAPDLFAFANLWKFAQETAARQTFVPAIFNRCSQWLPILGEAAGHTLDGLVAAIPKSACALRGCTAQETSPARIFEEMFDTIIRDRVSTLLTRAHANRGSFDEVHSAWLASLRSPSPKIRWHDVSQIDAFADDLERWRRPVTHEQNMKYRLGLRLSDPQNPDAPEPLWRLTPLIIGNGQSLILSEKNLDSMPPEAQEHILTSLGQASQIFPPLAECDTVINNSIILDSAQTHLFLKSNQRVLNAAGFQVYAPAWFRHSAKKGGGQNESVRPRIIASFVGSSRGQSFLSLDELIQIKWNIALGKESLTPDEVKEILSSGRQIIRRNSQWIFADRRQLTAVIEKYEELLSVRVTPRMLIKLALSAETPDDKPLVDLSKITSNGQFGKLFRELRGLSKPAEIPQPSSFKGRLRPYQVRGLAWLAFLHDWGFGACLADDMGLGKTVEAIALLMYIHEKKTCVAPHLIVCPMSIMTKWQREIKRFAPSLSSLIFHGAARPLNNDFSEEVKNHDVVITSYQLLCQDFKSISQVRWNVVLLDEAQNIKNPATRKSQAARALKADWHLALTGTPVENNVGDLWAIMDFLNQGLLLTRKKFYEAFFKPIQSGMDNNAALRLKNITSPFILRRLKTDPAVISDLPPRIEEKVYCPLSPEQADLYRTETQEVATALQGKNRRQRRGAILALLTRLKQICNHPQQYLHVTTNETAFSQYKSGKLDRLDAILDEILTANECALIFTQYTSMGDILQLHLQEKLGIDIPFLHGGVSLKARDRMVESFQKTDGPPVFILSIKAGGTGLDLTRANHVFHYDRWWNPAVENQATDRAHRIGQNKTVFVHTFICEGTLESKIDDLIESKKELAGKLIKNGDDWLANLSDRQLQDIISLSGENAKEMESL